MVKHQNPEKFNAFVGGKMNKVLFAVFLIGIGIAAAQTPPDQERVAGSVRSVIPEPTKCQRIGNQIDAAMTNRRAGFR